MKQNIPSFQLDSSTGPIGYQIGAYKCLDLLGSGAFAKVYSGYSIKDSNLTVALKFIDKKKIRQEKSERIREIKEKLMKSEVEIMQKCNSQFVVKCYDKYQDQDHLIFVLEYCNDKDLSNQIRERKRIPQEQAIRILKQIINGFAEMHRHNIIHRDLKSQNIFKHNNRYKIGDMGFAKVIGNVNDISEGTMLGTLATMAPEVLKRSKYGIKADLWSLGIIYYEMLVGVAPYISYSTQGMLKQLNKQLNLNGISSESQQLLKKVLVVDPDERISWTELGNLSIFRKYQVGSVILDYYEEDIDIEESMNIHQQLQKKSQEIQMEKVLEQFDNYKPTQYDKPDFKKQKPVDYEISKQHLTNQITREVEIKQYVDRLNYEKDKSMFLLNHFINPLLHELDLSLDRSLVEFLYLTIVRAFFIISPIYNSLRLNKEKLGKSTFKYLKPEFQEFLSKQFIREFEIHYSVVYELFGKIQKLVFEQQTKIKSRITDFIWKRWDQQKYQEKDKYFTGIEGVDFTMQEQIDYTVAHYIPLINQKLQNIRYLENVKELSGNLQNYKKLLMADYDKDRMVLQEIRMKNSKLPSSLKIQQ